MDRLFGGMTDDLAGDKYDILEQPTHGGSTKLDSTGEVLRLVRTLKSILVLD